MSVSLWPKTCSRPGSSVLHCLLGFCSNSCPLSRWCCLTVLSSSTPCSFCLHQGLSQWVSSSHHVAKVAELQVTTGFWQMHFSCLPCKSIASTVDAGSRSKAGCLLVSFSPACSVLEASMQQGTPPASSLTWAPLHLKAKQGVFFPDCLLPATLFQQEHWAAVKMTEYQAADAKALKTDGDEHSSPPHPLLCGLWAPAVRKGRVCFPHPWDLN